MSAATTYPQHWQAPTITPEEADQQEADALATEQVASETFAQAQRLRLLQMQLGAGKPAATREPERIPPRDYDEREVPCPTCQAKVGSHCKRPSGHSGPAIPVHKARQNAADVLWRAEEMGKYGRVLSLFLLSKK